jgi:Fur family transcriptional regulator, peroxide stress response regulator
MDMKSQSVQLEKFEASCRDLGLKITHQRIEVFRELLMAIDHPTADTLYQRLRKKLPMISLDTVYRTLTTLAKYGLINKVETPESLARFEVTQIKHHHMICRSCGEIKDFIWPDIDEAALPNEVQTWGKIDNKNIVVYGVCRKCPKKTGADI